MSLIANTHSYTLWTELQVTAVTPRQKYTPTATCGAKRARNVPKKNTSVMSECV